MITLVLAMCAIAFVIGICLGMTLRVYWVWFAYGVACAALGAALATALLWWLGADFSTIQWRKLATAIDLLTASIMFNVVFAFLAGLWVGFVVLGQKFKSYVVTGS